MVNKPFPILQLFDVNLRMQLKNEEHSTSKNIIYVGKNGEKL